jgi:cell wall assembly regulator SMI1
MPFDELVRALAPADAHAADAAAIAAAETRIAQPLPAELRALYQRADGIDPSGIAPIGQLRRADAAGLADAAYDGTLHVADARGATFEVPLARVARWLRLGGDEATPQVYYDPDTTPALPGLRVVEFDDGEVSARPDLRALFAAQWVAQQQIAQAQRQNEAEQAAARTALRDLPLAALLDEIPQPTLVARVLFHQDGLPGRADAASIDAASRRIGAPLPDDLLELYRRHDGLPPLGLFQVEWLERVEAPNPVRGKVELDRTLFDRDFAVRDEFGGDAGRVRLDAASLGRCVVAGGYLRRDVAGRGAYVPRILWCPGDTPQPARWIELPSARIYPTFRAWLLDKAATMRASRG